MSSSKIDNDSIDNKGIDNKGMDKYRDPIFNGDDIYYFRKLLNYIKNINLEKLDKNCLRYTSSILPISIIDAYIYKKKDLVFLYTIASITSLLYHHNIIKNGQILDRTCIRIGTIYVYLNYFLWHKTNLKFLSIFGFSSLLYIPSMYLNSNLIHSVLHIGFLYSSFLLNRTGYIK